jgi:ketosteroid isomerase-like protein
MRETAGVRRGDEELLEILRPGYEALSRGDLDGFLKPFASDAVLHELPEMPDAGAYHGHAGMRRWAEAALELAEEWSWEPQEILASGDDILVVRVRLKVRGRESHLLVEQDIFHEVEYEGEQATVIRGFLNPAAALAAAGGRL